MKSRTGFAVTDVADFANAPAVVTDAAVSRPGPNSRRDTPAAVHANGSDAGSPPEPVCNQDISPVLMVRETTCAAGIFSLRRAIGIAAASLTGPGSPTASGTVGTIRDGRPARSEFEWTGAATAAARSPSATATAEEAPRFGRTGALTLVEGATGPRPLDEPDPTDPAEPVVSANAIGSAAAAEPMPKATANAPIRPTYRAKPALAPGLRAATVRSEHSIGRKPCPLPGPRECEWFCDRNAKSTKRSFGRKRGSPYPRLKNYADPHSVSHAEHAMRLFLVSCTSEGAGGSAQNKAGQTFRSGLLCVVELPGIEPGSYGIPSRLLRAQSAMSLLGSPALANKSG